MLAGNSFAALMHQAKLACKDGPRGRYAPSPTGALHLGNARTALLAWLQIRLQKGIFVMRMEDLDGPRVLPGCAAQILDDLEWMGLDWDEGGQRSGSFSPYEQSQRGELYALALDLLHKQGRVFACTCSRKDIAMAASAPHGRTPVYPGTCRWKMHSGSDDRAHSLRYRVPDENLGFSDKIMGTFTQHLSRDVGDFVLRRADGLYAYQLAVVVDDLLMGITDVVRGIDLIDSTPRQILLGQALGASVPAYWHVPLMSDQEGRRMSKRYRSQTIAKFRADGGSPSQLVALLAASVGLVKTDKEISPNNLLQRYDLDSFKQLLSRVSQPAA